MGLVNTPQLSTQERLILEQGFREGESHCFRTRCHVILLKADGRTSKDVGLITDMSHISVNHWGNVSNPKASQASVISWGKGVNLFWTRE